jgi:hypothetical protein
MASWRCSTGLPPSALSLKISSFHRSDGVASGAFEHALATAIVKLCVSPNHSTPS